MAVKFGGRIAVACLALSFGGLACAQDQWAALLSPENSLNFGFLKGDQPVFHVNLGGWGPRWSWVGLESHEKATSEKFSTTAPFVVNKAAGEVIEIKLGAWKSAPRQITLQYDLSAAKDVRVTMIIAGLGVNKAFAKGAKIVLTHPDGQKSTLNLPLGLGLKPAATKATLSLPGAGEVEVAFDPPCAIASDGDLRIQLAAEVFKQGARSTTLTFTFPGDAAFLARQEDLDRFTHTLAGPDWFAFTPSKTPGPSVISMNDWLEQPAGRRGGVRIVGDRFQFTDGTPVKFWGVNLSYGGGCAPSKPDADLTAARYAQYGVNAVRLHKFSYPKNQMGIGDLNDSTRMDPAGLDRLDYFSAQLKKQGVYFGWSHTYGYQVVPGDRKRLLAYDEIEKNLKGKTYAFINFAEDVQDLMIEMVVNLLQHQNPYTGLTYAAEPALCFLELQNEDDIFFYTSETAFKACPTYQKHFTQRFSDWLKAKYGSEEHLQKAWGSALKSGENLLALRLPQNFLGYRVYLTSQAPAQYPQLGEQLNSQWADFIRWQAATRQDSVRRSLEAMREVDPDRSAICMAPDAFIGGLEELCQDYGGHFHNTGSMAGWWCEACPMMMRAANLPNSAEPGGPARTLPEFKFFLGNWLTEGVNAIHYFIHIGDVFWNPEIRQWFETNQPMIAALGKMHIPKAELAMLFDDDVDNLLGWPWKPGHQGYLIQFNGNLHKEHHIDAVSLRDFARGFADGYRAVVDTESPVLDEQTVGTIEAWVRRGGVFITTGETGRHTPEKADAWPISRLTGYSVSKVTAHPDQQKMKFVAGQTVFTESAWDEKQLSRLGLHMQKVAPECQDLLVWPDGSVAVGVRKVGQGMVVTVGCKYNYSTFLLGQVLGWLKIAPIPGYAPDKQIISTHEVSNNGLYDVWVLFNRDQTKPGKSSLVFREGCRPEQCLDLQTKQEVPLVRDAAGVRTPELEFGPADIRILLTPRAQICQAPLDWLELQRGWWRGTTAPRKNLPSYHAPNTLALTSDWKMKPLADDADADQSALAAPGLDDSKWEKSDLGNWLVPDERPSHRAFFRKQFTVPSDWQDGEIKLWSKSWVHEAVRDRLRAWLDGKEIAEGNSVTAFDLTAQLKPRSTHLLAVEIKSQGQVAGSIGNTWLTHLPRPKNQINLAGSWTPSHDGLAWDAPATLPGPWSDWTLARRRLTVPATWSGQTAMILVETETQFGIYGVMINGRLVRRLHHEVGTVTSLNVTPWIKFGQENEIHITRNSPGKGAIKKVTLEFFPEGIYP